MSECNKPHHTSKFWHSDGTIYCNDCDAEAVGMSLVVDAVKQLRTETPPVPQPHTEKQDDYTQSGDETFEMLKRLHWYTDCLINKLSHEQRKELNWRTFNEVGDFIKSHATKGEE